MAANGRKWKNPIRIKHIKSSGIITKTACKSGGRTTERQGGRGNGGLYKDLDLVERTAADASGRGPGPCGLGGRDPEKKGCANLARALAARWEYLLA